MSTREIIETFWDRMATNDFASVSPLLSPKFHYHMPQTGESLYGPDAFARLNSAFPAKGKWQFNIVSLVTEHDTAVTETQITDGSRQDTAITFHKVRNGLILSQIEYWPDPYNPPDWRANYTTLDHKRPQSSSL